MRLNRICEIKIEISRISFIGVTSKYDAEYIVVKSKEPIYPKRISFISFFAIGDVVEITKGIMSSGSFINKLFTPFSHKSVFIKPRTYKMGKEIK